MNTRSIVKHIRNQRSHRRPPRSLADLAMKKLFEDVELSDQELDALFQSDYLKEVKENETSRVELFAPSQFSKALSSNILLLDTQAEILAYFAKHPEMLFSVPPRKFEELIASIFRNSGFLVELTPETRDGGVDIIAVRHDKITGDTLHLIECKRYLPDNKVGIGVVQRMMGVVEMHRATQGLIVTTSDFSREARLCADTSKHRLALNAYTDIAKWLRTIGK